MEKILKTSRYIFISLFIIGICYKAASQVQISQPVERSQSIALGIDLAPLIIKSYDHTRTGVTVSGRYGLKDKLFAVGEAGFENIEFFKSKIQDNTQRIVYEMAYKSNGSFLKVGIDYNIFNVDEIGNKDNILLGIRYGIAYQEHSSSSYIIGNGYWEDYPGSTSNTPVTSHWAEFIFGLRAELFKNFYMGWAIRAKALLFEQNSSIMEPYAIPGLGRVENGVGLGFSYTLEYQIPFGKKKAVGKKMSLNN